MTGPEIEIHSPGGGKEKESRRLSFIARDFKEFAPGTR